MRSVLRPMPALLLTCLLIAPSLAQEGIRWETNLDAAKRTAAQSNRLVLVHFWATWCTWCVPLEHEVFNKPDVARALEAHYVPVKLNFDQQRAVADKYGVRKLPWDVVIAPSGEKIKDLRSPNTAQLYVAQMTQIAMDARRPANSMIAGAQPNPGMQNNSALPTNSPLIDARYGQNPQSQPMTDNRYTDFRNQPPTAAIGYQPNGPAGALPAEGVTSPATMRRENDPYTGAPNGPGNFALDGRSAAPPASVPPQNGQIFALDGCCPVHLYENRQWVSGNPQFGLNHQGRTYLFAGPGCMEKFRANPDKYAPALTGSDPVLLVEQGQTVPGRREFGCFFGPANNPRVVLFASEETLQAFERNPQRYIHQIPPVAAGGYRGQ